MSSERVHAFTVALHAALDIESLRIIDESHLHAGHAGAAGGAGHFRIEIKAKEFANLGRIAKHRLVYDALSAWIPKDIHALTIITN